MSEIFVELVSSVLKWVSAHFHDFSFWGEVQSPSEIYNVRNSLR